MIFKIFCNLSNSMLLCGLCFLSPHFIPQHNGKGTLLLHFMSAPLRRRAKPNRDFMEEFLGCFSPGLDALSLLPLFSHSHLPFICFLVSLTYLRNAFAQPFMQWWSPSV